MVVVKCFHTLALRLQRRVRARERETGERDEASKRSRRVLLVQGGDPLWTILFALPDDGLVGVGHHHLSTRLELVRQDDLIGGHAGLVGLLVGGRLDDGDVDELDQEVGVKTEPPSRVRDLQGRGDLGCQLEWARGDRLASDERGGRGGDRGRGGGGVWRNILWCRHWSIGGVFHWDQWSLGDGGQRKIREGVEEGFNSQNQRNLVLSLGMDFLVK
jgi:hypothetical protein